MTTSPERNYSHIMKMGYIPYQTVFPPNLEHYCFACSEDNPLSLRLKFFDKPLKEGEKDPTHEVVSTYTVPKELCGFPKYAHGGILTTIMDEIMAYTAYKVDDQFGVTKTITANFLRPTKIGVPLFIKCHTTEIDRSRKFVEVHMYAAVYEGLDEKTRKKCADATGIYVILPLKMIEGFEKEK